MSMLRLWLSQVKPRTGVTDARCLQITTETGSIRLTHFFKGAVWADRAEEITPINHTIGVFQLPVMLQIRQSRFLFHKQSLPPQGRNAYKGQLIQMPTAFKI